MNRTTGGRNGWAGGGIFLLVAAFLAGQAHAQAPAPAGIQAGALRGAHIANAEVRVTSSGDARYLGMTNTDAAGRFNLAGVPAGGVNVQVWRNGALIARGAAVLSGDRLNEGQLAHIELVGPETRPKSGPGGK